MLAFQYIPHLCSIRFSVCSKETNLDEYDYDVRPHPYVPRFSINISKRIKTTVENYRSIICYILIIIQLL